MIEDLHKLLRYEDGKLYWLPRPEYDRHTRRWNSLWAGTEAGMGLCKHGYSRFRINSKNYKRARVVFAMHHGRWPVEVDHINGVRDDDRIENLREVTRGENCRNIKRNSRNDTGVIGVCHWRGNFRAQIQIDGDYMNLGVYPTLKRAAAVRAAAETLARWNGCGFHANHGRN